MWESMIEWYVWDNKKPESNHSWLGWDGWVQLSVENQAMEAGDE